MTELEGGHRVSCDDCGETHHVCPMCEVTVKEVSSLENGKWANEPAPVDDYAYLCAEWTDERLRIYWHGDVHD